MLGLQPCRRAAGGGPARLQHNRMQLYFFPEFIKGQYLSFLGIPSLDRRGLFQDHTDEMVQRKHGGSPVCSR